MFDQIGYLSSRKLKYNGYERDGQKSPNPLVHQNSLTNCPTKPTYLINGQIGASPIKPN